MIFRNFLAALLVFIFTACSGVKLSQKIELSPGDWLMSGNSPEQKNIAAIELAPPLYKMWEYDIEAGVGFNGITVADAVVFVNSLAGELYSFDVATGGKIGKLGFLGKDAGTSPLLLGNDLIITFAGDDKYSAASYNLLEGQRNWRKNFGYIQTSPVFKDGFVYFGTLQGNQIKIDDSTGNVIWKFYCGEPIHSTSAISGNYVMFGADKGSFTCLNLDSGTELWKIKINGSIYSTPLINNGTVFFGADDSVYYAVNIDNGSILWSRNMKTKITGGSTIFNDSLIMFGGIDGYLHALNSNTGEPVWSFQTYGTITSSPVTSGKYIYFTSFDRYLYCVTGLDGKLIWKYEFENKSRTTPVIWKDYLFTAADRSVFCFTNSKINSERNEVK